jgi:hypothetical protein
MSQSSDSAAAINQLYDRIAIAFLVLTVVACICTLALFSGAVSAPGNLAPSTEIPLPLPHTLAPAGSTSATPTPGQ